MSKLYCYVDETGQDTEGKFFVVAVVLTAQEKSGLERLCESYEKTSGKGKFKWGRAEKTSRLRYLKTILSDDRFQNSLFYSTFTNTIKYDESSPLTRLADALAGFVRDALENNNPEISAIFKRAVEERLITKA